MQADILIHTGQGVSPPCNISFLLVDDQVTLPHQGVHGLVYGGPANAVLFGKTCFRRDHLAGLVVSGSDLFQKNVGKLVVQGNGRFMVVKGSNL